MRCLRVAAVVLGALPLVCHGAPRKPAPTAEERTEPAAPPVLKRLKASVTTPLFVQETVGVNAIANITLTATATPTSPDARGEVLFTPSLGPSGQAVLTSVAKYLMSIHHGWPAGHRIEITYSRPIAPDDAAAAGLAAATELDSMIAGWEADPNCAVVGHLQADGAIQSVSSALSRLTMAVRAGVSRILMPEKNVTQAADCLVNEGVVGFGRVQIFAVKDFEEIPLMAGTKPEPDVAAAIKSFVEAQQAFSAAGADVAAKLKEPDVQESLRTVLEKWPNHVTARLLLGHAIGRYKTFSLQGSVEAIERIAVTLFSGIHSADPHDVKKLPPERIADELVRLRRATERIDPQARRLLDQVIVYGETARTWHAEPPRTADDFNELTAKLSAAAAMAQDERQKLAAALLK